MVGLALHRLDLPQLPPQNGGLLGQVQLNGVDQLDLILFPGVHRLTDDMHLTQLRNRTFQQLGELAAQSFLIRLHAQADITHLNHRFTIFL